ncbi:hypothetical protein J7E25_11850 [Agromyces sp. ISL-38]|uniref:hypothetical protein n=1 Tax=Agromyces sp. ISL-38 TaxID=2819107 RepID=UPI001BE617ED|nr:hypothetical protein [Agromyces sp. ISL-38]MBT2499788.1 hypothetical protein [Agromyces sp. ISL-38]
MRPARIAAQPAAKAAAVEVFVSVGAERLGPISVAMPRRASVDSLIDAAIDAAHEHADNLDVEPAKVAAAVYRTLARQVPRELSRGSLWLSLWGLPEHGGHPLGVRRIDFAAILSPAVPAPEDDLDEPAPF